MQTENRYPILLAGTVVSTRYTKRGTAHRINPGLTLRIRNNGNKTRKMPYEDIPVSFSRIDMPEIKKGDRFRILAYFPEDWIRSFLECPGCHYSKTCISDSVIEAGEIQMIDESTPDQNLVEGVFRITSKRILQEKGHEHAEYVYPAREEQNPNLNGTVWIRDIIRPDEKSVMEGVCAGDRIYLKGRLGKVSQTKELRCSFCGRRMNHCINDIEIEPTEVKKYAE